MSLDRFATFTDTPEGPATDAFVIVPSDTTELTVATKAIYVGTAGHVTVRPIRAAGDVTYRNVPAGSYLTVRANFVRATGTTAADLVGEV